jgi:hypothetical protein
MRNYPMKKYCFCLALIVALAACAAAQTNEIHATVPFGVQSHQGEAPTISYNGGPVFETPPNIYIIYYGKWTSKDHNVINGFFTRLGGTKMNKINHTYSDSSNKFVPNALNYDPATMKYNDNYSLGKSLAGDSSIRTIVANAIKNGHLPDDTNGIYFVLTAQDVAFPGMCTSLCGYHGPAVNIVTGETIKYSMVGNPAQCPSNCEASAVLHDNGSPNDDPGADGTINIMWHEFSETVSDPEVNMHTAWAGSCGENGDCCAWQFGNTFNAPNGHIANEHLGTKYYITQMMLELTTKNRGPNEPGVCENVFKQF